MIEHYIIILTYICIDCPERLAALDNVLVGNSGITLTNALNTLIDARNTTSGSMYAKTSDIATINTNIGTNVYSSLFSMNIIPGKYNKDLIDLKNSMFFVLSNFEPRIEKIQIDATSSVGKTLNFSITYTNKKTQEIQTLNITT